MSIEAIQQEIIEEFSLLEDWMDRYSLLIEIGNSLPGLDPSQKTDTNLIDGCQSKVWFTAELSTSPSGESIIIYKGDSDAILVKGIVALLIRVLSGHTPEEILEANLHFIDDIHLREHLSPTRSNGLASMLKQMLLYALTLKQVKKP